MVHGKRDWVILATLSTAWLLSARWLATKGGKLLPVAAKRVLLALDPQGGGLQSWSSCIWLATGALFLALAGLLLQRPRDDFGLKAPTATSLGMSALWGPVVLVVSLFLAWKLALPTILEELAAGGRRAVQRNTGALGRSLGTTPVAMVLVWAVLLTP